MAFTKEGTGSRRYMVVPMKTSLATTISIAGVVAAGAFTFAFAAGEVGRNEFGE